MKEGKTTREARVSKKYVISDPNKLLFTLVNKEKVANKLGT